MQNYQNALREVLQHGLKTSNRTNVNTRSILGMQLRYNFEDGFPAMTTKKLAWKAVVSELLWFMEGSTKASRLSEILHGDPDRDNIWTANAEFQGIALGYDGDELGPVYGHQWRNFGGYDRTKDTDGSTLEYGRYGADQLEEVRRQLKEEPESRRIIMSAWNPNQLDQMSLPPCHMMSQFLVQEGKLTCIVTQRSCDMFLGVPFNIASYALLTHILAADAGLIAGGLIWNGGDCHIYETHTEQVREQLTRVPMMPPLLTFDKKYNIYNYKVSDFVLDEYYPQDAIKADMVI